MSDNRTTDELSAAADRLSALLVAYETNDNGRDTWRGWMTGGLGGEIGDLAAVMGPDFIRATIALFRRGAWMVRLDRSLAHRIPMDEVFAAARAILGETS